MDQRFAIGATVLLVVLMAPVATIWAEDAEDSSGPHLDLSGFYAFNAYSQNNFFLGRGNVGGVSDKDEYAIQMFRLMAELAYNDNLKAVVRTDLAQGIWGIDNSQRDNDRPGFSNLFNNKDTNFTVHVDWAYVDYTHAPMDLNAKLGRMKYALGNLLILDQDADGLQLTKKMDDAALTFGYAKMSEGADSLSDEDVSDVGGLDTEDADLYLFSYSYKGDSWSLNPFIAHYVDCGDDDMSTYIPQGFQYFRARFTPQVSDATALGLAFSGTAGSWKLSGEVDYLTGSDDIANANSGPNQLLDVNNGDLEGYNLYLNATVPLGPGTFGIKAGMGSGDDDPMSGDGNINRIRTNGFFYLTEVWEDSVMPDEEGITPQGLGSPASRGYRELENTTMLQLNYSWTINPQLSAFVSGTWLQATEELSPWSDLNGDGAIGPGELGPESSDDLGTELDARLNWKITPQLLWVFRGGIFMPGDASGYLINGTDMYDDDAWELRTTVKFTFGGLRLGS